MLVSSCCASHISQTKGNNNVSATNAVERLAANVSRLLHQPRMRVATGQEAYANTPAHAIGTRNGVTIINASDVNPPNASQGAMRRPKGLFSLN